MDKINQTINALKDYSNSSVQHKIKMVDEKNRKIIEFIKHTESFNPSKMNRKFYDKLIDTIELRKTENKPYTENITNACDNLLNKMEIIKNMIYHDKEILNKNLELLDEFARAINDKYLKGSSLAKRSLEEIPKDQNELRELIKSKGVEDEGTIENVLAMVEDVRLKGGKKTKKRKTTKRKSRRVK